MNLLQKVLDNQFSQKPINQINMAVKNDDGSFYWSGVAGQTSQRCGWSLTALNLGLPMLTASTNMALRANHHGEFVSGIMG